MKTFKDLKFKPKYNSSEFADLAQADLRDLYSKAEQAILYFDNGYGCSVLFGEIFFSDGVDTYELAVLHKGQMEYTSPITSSVLGYITKEEVTKAMIEIQNLPPKNETTI